MGIKSFIQDGEGHGLTAGVTGDHAVKVTTIPLSVHEAWQHGQTEILTRKKTLSRLFVCDDLTTPYDGYTNMAVDGTIPGANGDGVEFHIRSQTDRMLSVYSIKFILHGRQMSISYSEGKRFSTAATAPGLTNGICLQSVASNVVTDIFAEPVKTITEFLQYSNEFINEPDALGSGQDLLVVRMDFNAPINIVPAGVDRFTVIIRDDLTSMDLVKVIALGTQEPFDERIVYK